MSNGGASSILARHFAERHNKETIEMKTAKTVIMTMIVAFLAIGMIGFAAAMNTNVVYSGDGQYDCNYDADGTGYIGIHTYTSDGEDHLMSGWTNSQANGWQRMNTDSGTTNMGTAYSGTVIDRHATVGGVGVGEDEAGFIQTVTKDNNGNLIVSYANYHDNHGYGSRVTTDQTVVVGSLVNIMGSPYNVTGVAAVTDIYGFSYGSDTTVSGRVITASDDEYTYAIVVMENGKMKLYTLSAAGSVDPAYTMPNYPFLGQIAGITLDGACGQWVEVGAKGTGVFGVGAGTDMHGAVFWMYENGANAIYVHSTAQNPTMDMTTTFDGDFDATGYVYAVDLS